MINKKILILVSLLLVSFLMVGCKLFPIPNQPPEITSDPVETATVGVDYTYDVDATDPNAGDILTYSLIDEPSGMLIDEDNGVITWEADDITAAGVGDYDVVVVVTDEGDLSDSQDFTITVSEFVVKLVRIEVEPEEMTLSEEGDFSTGTFKVTANYNDDSTNVVTSDCVYGVDDTSIAEVNKVESLVTALDVGTTTISISYTDDKDITKGTTLTVIVGDTITISWGEAAVRYFSDGIVHSSWSDSYEYKATLIKVDGEYHYADANEFYNYADLPNFEGSIVIDRTGQLTGWATYFLNLPTEDVFTGQVEIVVDGDGTSGTMVGNYTQKTYKFAETKEEVEEHTQYIPAIECADEEGKWLVGYTDYIAHE